MSLRSRRVLPGFVAVVAALASTGLSATGATAAGGDATVSTIDGLQTATSTCTSTCTSTGADPTTITVSADITDTNAQVTVACHRFTWR